MENSLNFALHCDAEDPLKTYRDTYILPQHDGNDAVYFLGNSLGLPLKTTTSDLGAVVDQWGALGVEGFFEGKQPWWHLNERLSALLAPIVGGKALEIICMNALTVNLHLLFVSFYRPTQTRFKILCEEKAFPSDQYLMKSQLEWQGFTADEALVEVEKTNEHWETADFISAIEQHATSLAMVFLGGVNYYNGQKLDIPAITAAAHKYDIVVGWDLAHAVGNIPLSLHEWGVDFAAWCSYKYLNGGPGAIGGAFVHEKHHNKNLGRLAGWWGHDKASRFEMPETFLPEKGAAGWELSTPSILALTPLLSALEQRHTIGEQAILEKQQQLTAYLEWVIRDTIRSFPDRVSIITPEARGCQISLLLHSQGRVLFESLQKQGIIVDWREPDTMRMAPVPSYNSFQDIFRFGQALKKGLLSL